MSKGMNERMTGLFTLVLSKLNAPTGMDGYQGYLS